MSKYEIDNLINKETIEMINKYPITDIEIRQFKNINMETIILSSNNSTYQFDDVITIDYAIYLEVYKDFYYITHQYNCTDLDHAREFYNKYIGKVKVIKK